MDPGPSDRNVRPSRVQELRVVNSKVEPEDCTATVAAYGNVLYAEVVE